MQRVKTLTRFEKFLLGIFFSLAIPHFAIAQKNVVQSSPAILRKSSNWNSDSTHLSQFIFYTTASLPLIPDSRRFKLVSRGNGIYIVNATPADITNWLKKVRGFVFWDELVKPVPEAGVINHDMTLNHISEVWRHFPQTDGLGQTVSVKEGRPDTNDIDLSGKQRNFSLASAIQDNHATIMSTLIVGAGNSSYRGKGVAHAALYSSSDFEFVLPDSIGYYRAGMIHVQNHSYGTGIQNFYGVNARAFDQSALDDTTLLHIISAGNSGTAANGSGAYAGLPGFANITGNFKQAKNVLLAGAQVADGTVPAFSSKGPLYDGRIAPHMVAFGDDGTSGAAALISGVSLMMHQQYRQQYGSVPGNALVKAILINTARDLGKEGPDYTTGYGSLDAAAALRAVVDGSFVRGIVPRQGIVELDVNVGAATQALKVTLIWNDPAAEPGIGRALLNDLDLEVVHVQTGQVYLPWTLAVAPSVDSLSSPAIRRRDSLNNVEQVSINLPAFGQYKIRVRYPGGTSAQQAFSLAYQLRPTDLFKWDFPLRGDQWISSEEQWLRWTADDTSSVGALEMSTDEGRNWKPIADQVSVAAGQFKPAFSDTMRLLRFRMKIGQSVYETADNVVAPSRALNIGLVCDTTALLYWNGITGAQEYVVYGLQNNQMIRVGLTSDTSIQVNASKGKVFALAGKFQQTEGTRGVAVDYRNQQVGCYVNRFFAGPRQPNTASMILDLGTLYNVAGVEILKRSDKDRSIFMQKPVNVLSYTANDFRLHQGKNIYQVIVTLKDGAKVYSNEQTVYYLGAKKHLIYPNPVSQGQTLSLLSELAEDLKAELIDLNGKLIHKLTITDNLQRLPTSGLPRGMYVLRIHEADSSVQRYSFIVH
ncbi:MAG: T9SS C-terminal target domain-containing protein [Sphingobacteriales bacterium]|nr:MAG: T9SS C-terminal target domain-containing protein [Sphingobacteriales bacterium]